MAFLNANDEGHHSTVSDRFREPIFIVLYISFYFFRLQFILLSLLKKDDKKESILCFYWEFYEGNLSDTPTKKLNDSSYPIFQILHLFFFLCMLAEGRVWDGGKQRQYHMVLLSEARLALKFTTYCNAAAVAGLCVSVGKKQRDKRSLGRL